MVNIPEDAVRVGEPIEGDNGEQVMKTTSEVNQINSLNYL